MSSPRRGRARTKGIRPGHSLAQARSLCRSHRARPRRGCERTAQEALLEVAGDFFAARRGCRRRPRLHRRRPAWSATSPARRSSAKPRCGPRGDDRPAGALGIAASKLAARVAAELPKSPTIVAAGSEAEFLAPLPLPRLTPELDAAATLHALGHRLDRRAGPPPRKRSRLPPRRARTRAALRRARHRSASADPARAAARVSRRDGARVAAGRARAVSLHRQRRARPLVEADGDAGLRLQAARADDDPRAGRLSRARDRPPRADARREDDAHPAPPRPRENPARRAGDRLLARRPSRPPAPRATLAVRPGRPVAGETRDDHRPPRLHARRRPRRHAHPRRRPPPRALRPRRLRPTPAAHPKRGPRKSRGLLAVRVFRPPSRSKSSPANATANSRSPRSRAKATSPAPSAPAPAPGTWRPNGGPTPPA